MWKLRSPSTAQKQDLNPAFVNYGLQPFCIDLVKVRGIPAQGTLGKNQNRSDPTLSRNTKATVSIGLDNLPSLGDQGRYIHSSATAR